MTKEEIIEIFIKYFKSDIKLIYEDMKDDFMILGFLYLPSDIKIILNSDFHIFNFTIWMTDVDYIEENNIKLIHENMKRMIEELKEKIIF